MEADLFQLQQFLNNTKSGLASLNELLANADKRTSNNEDLAKLCFRIIHAIKGEAAAIGLDAIETHANQFEEHLVALRKKDQWEAQEILSLPVMLSAMLKRP